MPESKTLMHPSTLYIPYTQRMCLRTLTCPALPPRGLRRKGPGAWTTTRGASHLLCPRTAPEKLGGEGRKLLWVQEALQSLWQWSQASSTRLWWSKAGNHSDILQNLWKSPFISSSTRDEKGLNHSGHPLEQWFFNLFGPQTASGI